MDHGYFLDRVSAYHDRDLPPQELALMEEHLRTCEECQALLWKFVQLDALVDRKAELAGGDYWEQAARKIEQRIASPQKTAITDLRPRRSFALGWKLMAAAASLVLLGYIGMHKDDIFGPVEQKLSTPSVNGDTTVAGRDTRVVPAPAETTTIERDHKDAERALRKELESRSQTAATDTRSTATHKKQETVVPVQKPVKAPPSAVVVDEELKPVDTSHLAQQVDIPEPGVDAVPPADTAVFSKAATAVAPAGAAAVGSNAAESAEGTVVDLASLRQERDSLTTLLANLDKAKGKLQLPTALDQGLVTREKKAAPKRQDVERQLLETSYQLLVNSSDSSECRTARLLLEKVAADSASTNRGLAARLLQQAARR